MRLVPDDRADYCPCCGTRLAMAYLAIREDDDPDGWIEGLPSAGLSQHARVSGYAVVEEPASHDTVPAVRARVYVHISADGEAVQELADEVGYPDPSKPSGPLEKSGV